MLNTLKNVLFRVKDIRFAVIWLIAIALIMTPHKEGAIAGAVDWLSRLECVTEKSLLQNQLSRE